MMPGQAAERVGLAVIGFFVVWRVLTLGTAEHFARQRDAGRQAIEAALAWYPAHSQALARRAREPGDMDPAQREALLRHALAGNPGDARVLMALAERWWIDGDRDRAAAAVDLAGRAAPADAAVSLAAAAYWLRAGQAQRAASLWDAALHTQPPLKQTLFPAFLRLTEDAPGSGIIRELVRREPAWWPDFFAYAATHALRSETVRDLFTLRREITPPSLAERRAYVDRLLRSGRWQQAYLAWMSGLDEEQRGYLGAVYNGSFEIPISGFGFDWNAPPVDGAAVRRRATYGAGGGHALQVAFTGQRVAFTHLFQRLLLVPGSYYITGSVRVDDLHASRGLQWQVNCGAGWEKPLATSERFVGSAQWRTFSFAVTVPAQGCTGQTLRLVALGRRAGDYALSGSIWFDDVTAVPVSAEP